VKRYEWKAKIDGEIKDCSAERMPTDMWHFAEYQGLRARHEFYPSNFKPGRNSVTPVRVVDLGSAREVVSGCDAILQMAMADTVNWYHRYRGPPPGISSLSGVIAQDLTLEE
jgi:hypothetical protein